MKPKEILTASLRVIGGEHSCRMPELLDALPCGKNPQAISAAARELQG